MLYLDVVLALLAFFGLCVFLNRCCGVAGGRTPLLSSALVLLWLMAFGIAGALRPGGWLLYLVCGVLFVWACLPQHLRSRVPGFQKTPRPAAPPLFDFGFAAFWAMTLAIAVLFAVRKPLFAEWDEMSFWGTACKLVKLNDELYTTVDVGWDWVGAQQPGAILLSYFMQFFGEFAPWKSFLGYDVLLFSAYAAVLSAIAGDGEAAAASWRRYTVGVPLALTCLLTPYLMTEYCRILEVTGTYMSAYGDIPAGIAAGGAAAWYFAARRGSKARPEPGQPVFSRGMWGIFPVLAAAGLIKENAFPVTLVAAGLAAADCLLCEKGKRLWKRFAFAAAALAAPMAAYLTWSRHIAWVVSQRVTAGEVGATNLSIFQVVILGIQQTLNPAARSEVFNQVSGDMLHAFFETKMTLVGSLCDGVLSRILGPENPLTRLMGTGACVAVTVVGLFLLAAVLCKDRAQRRRTLWAGALSTLGFVLYYWVLILSYAFIFKPHQAAALSDYNRYVCTYYLFWFLLALAHLAAASRTDRPRYILTGVLLVCAALSLTATARMVRPQMSVLAYPEATFAAQRQYEKTADGLREKIEAEGSRGSVFYVGTNDNGGRYFNYSYQLLPLLTDYSFGGGPLGSAENNDGSLYYHAYSCDELAAYLEQKEVGYIFLDYYDEVFRSEYTALFTDGLAAADAGLTDLYGRVPGDEVLFEPVYAAQGGDAAGKSRKTGRAA